MGRLTVLIIMVACTSLLAGQSDKGMHTGEATFQQFCISCHGPDGRAQTEMGKKLGAADLTSTEVQQHSNALFAKQVKDGKGKMPPFGDKLGDEEIQAVVEYVRKLGKQ